VDRWTGGQMGRWTGGQTGRVMHGIRKVTKNNSKICDTQHNGTHHNHAQHSVLLC
jgi:hypothetical protein